MCVCVCVAIGSVTHRNAKFTTTRRTVYRRYLEIASDHHTIHLQWSFVGCGLDQCKLVLSVAGEI